MTASRKPRSDSEPPMPLEQSLARLDEIARALEGGELELAESLALYEEGVRLLRGCETILSQADTRIEQLRASGDGFHLDPMQEGA
ncbi:MAG TPA: exodeoxyribonuclease VII small subunit [Longimicrobiaceae bacterium]|nr:exodeoxyribonuclease VII small subunit [Longimicrobiaceae bacterium]